MRVAEYTSEFGRWDEVERASDPRLRPYVHGYFATSSSLVRPTRERLLPTAEVRLVLLSSPKDNRIGSEMTVRGWIDLAETSHFQTVDVLWRDADVVIVAALKAPSSR